MSRELSHFSHRLPVDKLLSVCEEDEVHDNFQTSPYKSLRCSDCGFVNHKNRKGEDFCCIKCNYKDDSDVNAAKNQILGLPYVHHKLKYNKKEGFYWLTTGVYDDNGKERLFGGVVPTKDLLLSQGSQSLSLNVR